MMKNMHGHTKIELTNVNTGEVKSIEDNNMVTNAMEHLFNAPFDLPNKFEGPVTMWRGGGLNHTEPQSNILRYTRGLMLFEDPIPEDPDIINPPGGNKVIGVADTRTYSGPILEYGSYNSTESFIDMSAKKAQYVWDFLTSQANGKISAVSLIPHDHAQMAYGIATRDTSMAKYNLLNWIGSRFEKSTNWDTFYNYHLPKRRHNIDVNAYAWQRYVYPYFNLEKNFGLTNDLNYFITCNHWSYNRIERYSSSSWETSSKNRLDSSFFGTAESIKLGKFKLNSERFKFTDTCQDNDIQQDMEEITVTMPEELSTILKDSYSNIINTATESGYYTALIGDFQVTEKYIYIACVPFYSQNYSSSSDFYTGTIQPGQKFYIWRINIFNNFTSDYFEVENTLEEDIYFLLSNNSYSFSRTPYRANESFYIFDNNIVCNVNGYLYNYNISQQTWTPIMIKNSENKCKSTDLLWSNSSEYSVLKDTQNGLLIKGNYAYYKEDTIYNTPNVSIIDINNSLYFYSNSGGYSSLGVISSANQDQLDQYLHCFTPVYGHKLFKYAYINTSNSSTASPNILQGFAYRNPLLMTINNIDPVEKTNEYIMKVTYTLTWD